MTQPYSRGGLLAATGLGAAALAASPALTASHGGAQAAGRQMAMAQLDPQAREVVAEILAANTPPIPTLTPENARQLPTPRDAVEAVLASRHKPAPVEAVAVLSHRTLPGPGGQLLVRIYRPFGVGPFPVTVYFHGGGWVIANLDTYDASCRALCNAAGTIVVSVAYRQAPEHKFPAAADDAYAATQWVMANAAMMGGDPKRVAVAGESAGGNLAAVTTLMARDRGGKMPIYQVLVYPITNYDFSTPSYQEQASAVPLNKPLMMWFWQQYLRTPADGANPYASPLRAKSLRGLPAATVITDQFDPLRSEGEAYAARLRQAGVAVTATRYMGVMHEFFSMPAVLDKARQAIQEAAMGLRGAFARG